MERWLKENKRDCLRFKGRRREEEAIWQPMAIADAQQKHND